MAKNQKTGFLSWLFGQNSDNDWVSIYRKGEKYLAEKKLLQALGQFKKALEITREIGDRMAEGYQLKMLGVVSYEIGEKKNDINYLNNAVDYSEEAVKLSQEIGDETLEGTTLSILGNIYMARAGLRSPSSIVGTKERPMLQLNGDEVQHFFWDRTLASRSFEKSIAVFREAENLEGVATSSYLMAIALQKMHRYEHALTAANEAAKIWAKIGSPMLTHAEKLISQMQLENRHNA